jgi:superfamily II DNA or RNA helicase
MKEGSWVFSTEHRQVCRVLEVQTLWGGTSYRVWLPALEAVVRVHEDQLQPVEAAGVVNAAGLSYIVAAARVADAMTQDSLLAPMESTVIPLPHQVRALARAVANDRIRYLVADEVGLGKTIEAGLIMRELKLRGLVRRILVVVPKGLAAQWIAEMWTHFGERFQLMVPGEFSASSRLSGGDSPWRAHNQIVCPMDSVKPLDERRGWSRAEVAEYNRERFEDLVSAGWDLVVVDEAHRLGGSSDQVARYRLGKGLAEAAPYLLLLSATPHQGKKDAFHRLVALLDPVAFPDSVSVSKERVQPYVIRTAKRRAIDANGEPLFKPRQTRLVPVAWSERQQQQRQLYEAVTEYVRVGYNQALREKKSYVGFLMILMQRLVTSSTRAIRTTLERRLAVLQSPDEDQRLFPDLSEDDWVDLDGQEQMETLLKSRLMALKNERAEVKLLLEAGKRTEAAAPDAKAEALLDWIYRLQREETDPGLKVLIFTEFVPTQEMLREFLLERGFNVACLNGSLDMDERQNVQKEFAGNVRILISTDAGGEGLNLQFCHVIVNYDIPWNPMRLEQRIGRVDRIGQRHPVRALNLVLEDTVEYRVREVLERKLEVILEEFGVDKSGDVLDSAQAGQIFDDLYVDALLNPGDVATKVDSAVNRVREQAQDAKDSTSILGDDEPLDPAQAQKLMDHPLPHWIERMTLSFLAVHGGQVERNGKAWNLVFPDGERFNGVVFTAKDAKATPSAQHLTVENARIRGLAMRLPRFAEGQPIPCVSMPGLPADVRGIWSLWRIALQTTDWHRQCLLPLFVHEDGYCLQPTARHIWEELLVGSPDPVGQHSGEAAEDVFGRVWRAAETQGRTIYEELLNKHERRLSQDRERGEYGLAARRRMLNGIGLVAVRTHRLAQLDEEEGTWREQMRRRADAQPEMVPLLLISVKGGQ